MELVDCDRLSIGVRFSTRAELIQEILAVKTGQ